MALFNLKKLTSTIQEAAGSVANAAQEAAGSVANAAQEAAGNVTNAAQNLNVSEALSSLPDSISGAVEGIAQAVSSNGNESSVPTSGISSADSMRIFYYLMSADGELTDEELGRFNGFWDEFGLAKEGNAALIRSCESELTNHASSIPLVSAMAATDAVLYSPSKVEADEQVVSPRLLVWNMFAIAYADGTIDDGERELITHVAHHLEVKDAYLKEMESALLTLKDLEREEAWVKTTNQPYLTIEKDVKEIEERAKDVLVGVEALIAL